MINLKKIEKFKNTAAARKPIDMIKVNKPVINKDQYLKLVENIVRKAKDLYYNTGNLLKLTPQQIQRLPKKLSDSVKSHGTTMTDALFDIFEDYVKKEEPNSPALKVGAPVKKQKVKLPMPMPSLNKKKQDTIATWIKEESDFIVLSDKVDGVSLGIVFDGTGERKLYTRGDGTFGSDISYMADALKIPRIKKTLKVRAEIVMEEAKFAKWEKDFANPRNMVSGITNRNSVHPALKDCKVLAYQIIGKKLTPELQFENLESLGFKTPWWVSVDSSKLSRKSMENYLSQRKEKAQYAIDGLVVARNVVESVTADNPENMVAFKNNEVEERATAIVEKVEWRNTRTGMLFPRIVIEPIKLSGVTITYVSGKSGAFIKNSGIGPGAEISIARSGDVIPDVRSVIKKVKSQLPDVEYIVEGENFFAVEEAEDFTVQKLEFFYATIGIEKFKAATIKKVVDAGFDTVEKIYKISKSDFVKLTSKTGAEIYDAIHNGEPIELATLMHASQVFGRSFGKRRFAAIISSLPDFMTIPKKRLVLEVDNIAGFDVKTARAFAEKVEDFNYWLESCPFEYVLQKKIKKTGKNCEGQKVLFTGFRDKELENEIVSNGGEIATSVSKATILVAADPNGSSSKLNAARNKGIKIYSKAEFIKKFNLKM